MMSTMTDTTATSSSTASPTRSTPPPPPPPLPTSVNGGNTTTPNRSGHGSNGRGGGTGTSKWHRYFRIQRRQRFARTKCSVASVVMVLLCSNLVFRKGGISDPEIHFMNHDFDITHAENNHHRFHSPKIPSQTPPPPTTTTTNDDKGNKDREDRGIVAAGPAGRPRDGQPGERPEGAIERRDLLIGVIASRRLLHRMASIRATWGHPSNLERFLLRQQQQQQHQQQQQQQQRSTGDRGAAPVPTKITIKYFIGSQSRNITTTTTSNATTTDKIAIVDKTLDAIELSKATGVPPDDILILDVSDDVYPPLNKRKGTIKTMDSIASGRIPVAAAEDSSPAATTGIRDDAQANQQHPSRATYQWIFLSDDDTYVNIPGLVSYTQQKDSGVDQYLGYPGTGFKHEISILKASGLRKPYCTGGSGILYSRSMLSKLAATIDECVQHLLSTTKMDIHDDVFQGICVQRVSDFRTFCRTIRGEGRSIFLDFTKETPTDPEQLLRAVSLHPYKDPERMKQLHDTYQNLLYATQQ